MTWKQFKDAVEAAGTKDEDTLYWIDTGASPEIENLNICIDEMTVGLPPTFLKRLLRVHSKQK